MKCSYCQERAGWFTRICQDCQRLLTVYEVHKGQIGLLQFLDLFIETGLPREKIEAFLAADPRGEGSIKDHILADMSGRCATRRSAASADRAGAPSTQFLWPTLCARRHPRCI